MRYAFGIWTVLVALTVSVAAAYYSIVGLTAIFAGAMLPVIVMGAALEVGKVTAAIWLHSFWDEAGFLMKMYLVPAVAVLMFITSMGIFGFLSKAHIEQGASGTEVTARIERLTSEINRQESIIKRANSTIAGFSDQVSSADDSIQSRIDSQQAIINDIRLRLGVDIATQNAIIKQETDALAPLEGQLQRVEAQRNELAALRQGSDIRALQRFIGANADGVIGSKTRELISAFAADLDQQQTTLFAEVERLRNQSASAIKQTRDEIQRLQQSANQEIQLASDAIASFRNQLVTVTTQDRSADIVEQNKIIEAANAETNKLFEERFGLETDLRAIEVEVGPVKYIAELIYGDADGDILEKAVRWVILILVAVFDPLAVILILAGLSIMHRTEQDADPANITPDWPVTATVEQPKAQQQTNVGAPESDTKDNDAVQIEQPQLQTAPKTNAQKSSSSGFIGKNAEPDSTNLKRVIRTTPKER
jgi:hypothetical protein